MDNYTTKEEETSDVAFQTFIGVLVSVCGNALISVALNVQKRAHNNIQSKQMANYFANMDDPPQYQYHSTNNNFYPDDGYSSPRSSIDSDTLIAEQQQKFIMSMETTKGGETEYLKSKLWWLGISLMILGEVGNFVAYGFAPASTIAPLGTTTLVSNVILAPLMLKEVFRKRDLIGVIFAVTGAAMVVFSSNSEEIALSPELIMEALTQMQSVIYFILTGVAIVVLTILSPIYGASSIMIDLGLVAIYGGYTVLSTKSVASLLSLTFFKMFAYPVSYLLIFVLVVTAVLQIKYLNKALQRFDSTEVIPTQFVLFTVSAIIGSAVLYHDFDGMDFDQMSRFMSGCAMEFLGVYLITSKRNKRQPINHSDAVTVYDQEEDEEEALDRVNLLPSEQQQQSLPIVNHNRNKRISFTGNNAANRNSANPQMTFEQWQEANSHLANSFGSSYQGHRRHSSVFRGISMASQLLDRNDESNGQIQLPVNPSPSNSATLVNNLINNISSAIHHTRSEEGSSSIADAVEIEIPTSSTFHHQRQPSERELMPLNRPHVKKLVDIDEEDHHS